MGILDSHPEYTATSSLDDLRAAEYSYLDEQDHVYLDYTGAGLAAKAQHAAHAARLSGTLFGNPHSQHPPSASATTAIATTRARVLAHLNASPAEYVVIFTPNATAAARLVGEAYPFRRGRRLVLTTDNHNSVNGLREFARQGRAKTVYVPTTAPELRVDTAALLAALPRSTARGVFSTCFGGEGRKKDGRNGLLAYPAQSNFSGVRHPLGWVSLAQERGYDVLLDAAAYLPTATLDLSGATKPEFVIMSWYKVFGYPTGVGCLVAKREALERLGRPWFSGGTIQAVSVGVSWHRMAGGEEGFEDGTVNFLAIPDVGVGLDWLAGVGMGKVEVRVRCLTGWFLDRLKGLRHSDGRPMAVVYGPRGTEMRGGTVTFNFLDARGRVVDDRIVGEEAAAARIAIRTGCFCNPGAGESAFGIRFPRDALRRLMSARHVLGLDEYVGLLGLPSAPGAVRVSFGVVSNTADVDRFFGFAEKTYKDRVASSEGLPPRTNC
ncbi:pyridoxal phosphate-dependent transferase [Podospora appendiculata]|uniref:Pyridoxal phosphate-dependent transferase n=1 Tax=Podospora appendiculata TaxID=314037 RepID=A0AAE1CB14_9PEZI|nr:pyridoxal phosphate-dependent transferase [Podospora appendiculata]